MTWLRVRLLGTFQVDLEGAPITQFESNKVRALLAYLAVEHRQAHSREKLAALFWPEMPARRASSNLSQALYNLRRLIQDYEAQPVYLLRGHASIQFNPGSDFWLDVEAFNQVLDGHPPSDPPHPKFANLELENLRAALDLYQGDFLEGFTCDASTAFDEWLIIMRQQLLRRATEGYHHLAGALAVDGDIEAALPYAWRQMALDPLNEPACRQLMRLLAHSGRRNQALAQFDRLQVVLAEELAVEPEPATLNLRDHIRVHASPTASLPQWRDNLPSNLSPLVGRQAELAEVCQRLESPDCRLLTILGPGGSGKTRLAIEAARLYRASFSDGINFTALNPVTSPVSILPTIAESLDLPRQESQDSQAQLVNFLREKNLLLVLDGFEHLVVGAALLADLLRGAPGLKIMVTSRARLNLRGENLYRLPGMGYPGPDAPPEEIMNSDAVQLLLKGLKRGWQGGSPGPEDLVHLLRICQQVQGMPLGILLAASWGATFSLAEIAEQISRSLDFLVADWADVPTRQRSLRATFDHSLDLLSEQDRAIFLCLSVFRGAFTRKAARQICGGSPHKLRVLVDCSLLESKIPGWYQVHELLRQYGRDKLALTAKVEKDVCQRHSLFYLNLLSKLGPELKTDGQQVALSHIDFEHENIRTAWDRVADQGMASEFEGALEALCLYYDLSVRYQDGKNICQEAIAGLSSGSMNQEVDLALAYAYTWQSHFTRLLGQLEGATQLIEIAKCHLDGSKESGDQVNRVEAFLTLENGNNNFQIDRTEAANCYRHSLGIFRELGDSWGEAKALDRLGLVAHHAGNFQEAVDLYSECLDLHRIHGDPRGLADALIGAGQNSLRLGLAEQGERFINEGVDVLQQVGDQAGVARGFLELARFLYWTGSFTRSYQCVRKSIAISKDLGILDLYIFGSIGRGLALFHLGRYQEAITGVLDRIPIAIELDARREIGMAYLILGMAYVGRGDSKAAENWALKSVALYRELNQQEELCQALAVLAYTQLNLGDLKQTRRYLSEILQVSIDIHGIFPVLHILFAVARILIEQGKIEKALEISALSKRYSFVENSQWFEDIAGREIASAAKSLPPEVVEAAQERGRGMDLWETADELLGELALE